MTIHNIIDDGKTMSVVPFTLENYRRCLCPGCLVQAGIGCVAGKETNLQIINSDTWASIASKPESLPALYCSGGKSDCIDIDTLRMCECSGCPIFIAYGLSEGVPKSYFCRDGCQLLCKE